MRLRLAAPAASSSQHWSEASMQRMRPALASQQPSPPCSSLQPGSAVPSHHRSMNPAEFPEWSFDGSSTGQAEGKNSDCILRPVYVVRARLHPAEVNSSRACRAWLSLAELPSWQADRWLWESTPLHRLLPCLTLDCHLHAPPRSAPTRSAAETTCW